MDQRASYLIQILEKIGSPLMTSIIEGPPTETPEQDAQIIAALLAKTVQTSIEMGNATELANAGIQDDSLRVALAALAGPLVAQQYKQSRQIPAENDLKKITSAIQAVLTFSENFAPSPENTQRLADLAAAGQPVDAHQTNIQYIQAFVPVINAIGSFSFGQPEQKLVTDITSRLVARAESLRSAVLGGLAEDEQKRVDLGILRALSHIYADCHNAETARLMAMNEEQRANQPQAPGGGLSLDPVWQAFDLRSGMLEEIAKLVLPQSAGGTTKAPTPQDPPAAAPPPQAPPPVEQPQEPPPTPTEQPPQQATGNPMATFADPNKSEAQEAAPNEPPPQPPPQETQAPPPSQDSGTQSGGQGNPMSFFKTPPKDGDEE